MNNLELKASGYIYKRDNKWSFLDRKDRLIKLFNTRQEAIKFAMENIHLIDGGQYAS